MVAVPHRGGSQQPPGNPSASATGSVCHVEEPDSDTDRLQEEHPQDLSRLRLDAWDAASAGCRGNQQVLMLELTRAEFAFLSTALGGLKS